MTADFFLKLTEDGSYTFFSEAFGETFHSSSGAKEEAEKKFVASCQIAQFVLEQSSFKLLDICYGLGYNTAAALDTIWRVNPDCRVELIALELDPSVPCQALKHHLLSNWKTPIPECLTILAHDRHIETPQLRAKLLIGDARQTIQQVYQLGFQAQAIFLDPFSPTKCPQLWTVEFLALVAKCLHEKGYLATYSCAASVRAALHLAGLQIGATQSVGRRSPGTLASYNPDGLQPLSQQELEHLQTRAAIPYRDPNLIDSSQTILQRRQQEQAISSLEPSSHWKKRWNFLD